MTGTSPWLIFLLLLGPVALFLLVAVAAQLSGWFNKPAREPTRPGFGERRPLLTAVLLVSGVGFLFGLFTGGVAGAVAGAVGGPIVLLVLSLVPALVITIVQSVRHRLRRRSLGRARSGSDAVAEGASQKPFHRRFASNFRETVDTILTGWVP